MGERYWLSITNIFKGRAQIVKGTGMVSAGCGEFIAHMDDSSARIGVKRTDLPPDLGGTKFYEVPSIQIGDTVILGDKLVCKRLSDQII